MFEKVKKILVDELNVDESLVTPNATIKGDLGADSIDILQLLMTLEEESGITIPDEKLSTFQTVGDIVNYLESLYFRLISPCRARQSEKGKENAEPSLTVAKTASDIGEALMRFPKQRQTKRKI